jgi:hypothetical protein
MRVPTATITARNKGNGLCVLLIARVIAVGRSMRNSCETLPRKWQGLRFDFHSLGTGDDACRVVESERNGPVVTMGSHE